MKQKMTNAAIAGALLLGVSAADAAVWAVEKDDHKIYVGGTIHMLGAQDYPLPSAYQTAYADSSEIWFETDVPSLSTPDFQASVMAKHVYQDGQTFADHVAPETLSAIKQHLSERGLTYEQMQVLSPGLMAVTLTMVELQLNGVEQAGIDAHFASQASTDGKPIAWFESIDQQVEMISAIAEGHEDEYLQYTLDSVADTMEDWETIRSTWRDADLERLDSELISPLMNEAPYAYEVMVHVRNDDWMPKIESLLEDADTEFVLVGMLHLGGPDGVLTQLEAQGYSVTPVE